MRDKTIDQPNERPRVLDVDGSWPVRVLIPIRGGMAAEISVVVPLDPSHAPVRRERV